MHQGSLNKLTWQEQMFEIKNINKKITDNITGKKVM
jgi:hypothetical protein